MTPFTTAELERFAWALLGTPDTAPEHWLCPFCVRAYPMRKVRVPGGLADHWRACGVLAPEGDLGQPPVPGPMVRPSKRQPPTVRLRQDAERVWCERREGERWVPVWNKARSRVNVGRAYQQLWDGQVPDGRKVAS